MKAETEIRILVVEPHKRPYEKRMPNELANMQEIVGGYIEPLDIEDGVAIVCNEEGKINRMTLNRAVRNAEGVIVDVIAGTFFIAGTDFELGEFISLTDEQVEKYKNLFEYPQDIFMLNGKVVAIDKPFHIDPDSLDNLVMNPKAPTGDKPTRDEFAAYKAVQMSGIVNMHDLKTVQGLTDLSKEKIIYIMKNYTELNNEYK